MRKLTVIITACILLFACNNQSKPKPIDKGKGKEGIDSSYATYSIGNSIETFTTKVYILTKDTALLKQVDSATIKKVDTTLVTYFIPRLDTMFVDQGKRQRPVLDSITKKAKTTIVWIPMDESLVLIDYKKKK